jgi:hypothetical protein
MFFTDTNDPGNTTTAIPRAETIHGRKLAIVQQAIPQHGMHPCETLSSVQKRRSKFSLIFATGGVTRSGLGVPNTAIRGGRLTLRTRSYFIVQRFLITKQDERR